MARRKQHQAAIHRTVEGECHLFDTAATTQVVFGDARDQRIAAESGVRIPEIAAGHDQRRSTFSRLDDRPQRLIGMQSDDQVVEVCRSGVVDHRPVRDTPKRPAARIDHLCGFVVMLGQDSRQHALPTRHVRDIPGIGKSVGDEPGGRFESSGCTVKRVPAHSTDDRTGGTDGIDNFEPAGYLDVKIQ